MMRECDTDKQLILVCRPSSLSKPEDDRQSRVSMMRYFVNWYRVYVDRPEVDMLLSEQGMDVEVYIVYPDHI